MYETSGVLRPAVLAYLHNLPLTQDQIAALRAYCRQWIEAPGFRGPEVEALRASVNGLTTRRALEGWLDQAEAAGVDPL